MHRRPAENPWARGVGLFATLLALAIAFPAWAVSVPAGFQVTNAVPGTAFNTPTGIAFLPDGRMLVAEKQGIVWVVQNGTKLATPFWDAHNEVLNNGDRGLLDVAVDPNYNTNHFVYFLYTVDPDTNGNDNNDDAFGRLTRYQVNPTFPNVVSPTTRAILFGRVWGEGPCSGSTTHTIGSLRWGKDGSLIVSEGEGAQFESRDDGGRDPNMFGVGKTDPYEDIGAFRAQYIGSLAGKILRINPLNGHGYMSNPFHDANLASVQSRVWAYGVRNPFRICVRPGTGSPDTSLGQPGAIYVGDVGWDWWEEISVATQGGRNFGWPCYEGTHVAQDYLNASPAHHDCSTIGTSVNPSPHTPPITDWNHLYPDQSSPAGISGNAATGVCFYTGTSYPALYQGALFYQDYGQSWLRVITVDASNNPVQWIPFGTNMDSPVDLVADPASGDLIYVSISTGEVRRIHYVGGANNPPTAVIGASPTSGPAPLAVNFSSAGSSDPDPGDVLSYSWVFGDGTGSFAANPSHTYTAAGFYTAVLTVNDGHGGTDAKQVLITVGAGNTKPTAIITAPVNNDFYVQGQAMSLVGTGSDAQQAANTLGYQWDIWLHHNNHFHPNTFVSNLQTDTFTPGEYEDGTGTWLEVRLYVTDSGGLSDTTSVLVWPEVDLEPSPITVTPDPARRIDLNNFAFKIYNHGRMIARRTHWELLASSNLLAEGDTLVAALDSLAMYLPVDTYLDAGSYDLRAVVDTFNVAHETNETNNAVTRPLSVVVGPVGVGSNLLPLELSSAVPNPTTGRTTFFLQLPRASRVAFTIHDIQGRQVWASGVRDLEAGRWPLVWESGGMRAGVYLARVQVEGQTWVRRIAVLR